MQMGEQMSSSDIAGIKEWFAEHAITEVECLVSDMTGILKGKIIPSDKYLHGSFPRLPDSVFIQHVAGGFPEDDQLGFWNHAELDMQMVPDPKAMFLAPWAHEPTAQVIHDCVYMDGSTVDIAPRQVLKKVLALYEARGWTPIVAPEMEFYLVKTNQDADYPLEPPVGRSGRTESGRQSYSIDALNEFDPLFEEMYDFCEQQQLGLDTLIHEEGSGQMEINFRHGDPLRLADEVVIFKRTLREVAYRKGMYATFMAKPMSREPGSAMHIHHSIVDKVSGEALFADRDGQHNELFLGFIGGLQHYLPMAMPFLAPNINSYRRLVPNENSGSAPSNVEWGVDNRTVGLRVPASDADNQRVENRLPGADANPYLAIAASLACGYLGMVNKLPPRTRFEGAVEGIGSRLTRHPDEALNLLGNCQELADIMGERFVQTYTAVKQAEFAAYFEVVSSWEREHLLLHV